VRLYAAVLGQADDDQRLAVTRSLFAEVEAALQSQGPAVPAGTVVGRVETAWGASVDVVTDEDTAVVLWNGAAADAGVQFDLGENREAGDDIGALTVTGPVDAAETAVSLAEDLEGPDPWWRLTHPLEIFGLTE
jgi:D-alanyl-D-alanine carboxypeptidase (penicillin-binding protein 5/6)